MTAIVGLIEGDLGKGDRVWLAADSAGVDQDTMHLRTDAKVWRASDELVIGSCGSLRVGQLLQYVAHFPPLGGRDEREYLVGPFAAAVRDCLRENGRLKVEEGVECMEGALIVGVRGRLFHIDDHWGVIEPPERFAAVGIGAPEALGAMWALTHAASSAAKPRVRLEIALRASERWNTNVRGPFAYVHNSYTARRPIDTAAPTAI